jgi:hypothetical protein
MTMPVDANANVSTIPFATIPFATGIVAQIDI